MSIRHRFGSILPGRGNRLLVLLGVAAITLGINFFGLFYGITVFFSHLLYLPVVLAGYWFSRRGILIAAGIALIYGVMSLALSPPEFGLAITTLSRMAVLVFIGGVVSFLSLRLRESEQQLHDIIEFSPDATFAIDREGKVIAWNRAIEELTGVGKAKMLGRGDYEYALPFYGERRPVLVDLALSKDPETGTNYPDVRRESDKFESEGFIPGLHGGKGAHLRFAATALVDADGTITGAIESIRDVTEQVMTKTALQNTGNRLNILAGIIRNDLSKTLAALYGHLTVGVMKFNDPEVLSFIGSLTDSANAIQRQIEISRAFRELGTSPPAWLPVQSRVTEAASRLDFRDVSFRPWTERLYVFADPGLATAFYHLFEVSLSGRSGATKVVVTYQLRENGCAVIIEDDGSGIPAPEKQGLFSQGNERYGNGLFLAHEILAITGMAIRETGVPGSGVRFEILVPPEGYRIS